MRSDRFDESDGSEKEMKVPEARICCEIQRARGTFRKKKDRNAPRHYTRGPTKSLPYTCEEASGKM